MNSLAHFLLTPTDASEPEPLSILGDFADAVQGWVYLERASREYADEIGRPTLVLRHHREGAPPHVDFAFVSTDEQPAEIHLSVLDSPDTQEPLGEQQYAFLLETMLEDLQNYLTTRPDPVTVRVTTDHTSPASS